MKVSEVKSTNTISPTLTLMALAISAFAIGITEFISVGLLPLIAKSFNVAISTAGLTVSIYALGITVGDPFDRTNSTKTTLNLHDVIVYRR